MMTVLDDDVVACTTTGDDIYRLCESCILDTDPACIDTTTSACTTAPYAVKDVLVLVENLRL